MENYRKISNYDRDAKLLKYNTEHKVYCEHCGDGHGVIFYDSKSNRDKLICPNCGYYVFKNKLARLKYEMEKRGIICKVSL